MANQEKLGDDTLVVPKYAFNPVPTLYADGIANVATGPGTVRTYLIRFDPSLMEHTDASPTVTAQLIMPTNGFLMIATFFEAQIKSMLASGQITQQTLDEVRAMVDRMTNAPGR